MMVGPAMPMPEYPGSTGARPEALLVVDDLLHEGGPAAAVLGGPRDADPARRVHPPLPRAPPLERLPIRRHPLVGGILDAQVVGEIVREPAADLGAEPILLGRVGEIHAPRSSTAARPTQGVLQSRYRDA